VVLFALASRPELAMAAVAATSSVSLVVRVLVTRAALRAWSVPS
jgi:hypothetical protein